MSAPHGKATPVDLPPPVPGLRARMWQVLLENRRIVGAMGPTLAARLFVVVAGVISSVLTAKLLGPSGRGDYFYVVTLGQLATQLGHLGLASSNTYVIARQPGTLSRLAANSVWVSLVVGLLVAAVIITAEAMFGRMDRAWLAAVLPILVPCLIYGALASSLLVGMGLSERYNTFVVVSTGLQLAAIGIVALVHGSTGALLWVSTGAALMAAVGLFWGLRRLGADSLALDVPTLRANLGYAGRVYIATLVPFFVGRINVLMLDWWGGPAELGYYSIAIQLFDTLLILPSTTAMLLFPELVKSAAAGRLSRTARIAVTVAVAMAVVAGVMAALVPWLLPVLFGQSFGPSVVVFWCMLPGLLACSVLSIVSQYLAAEGFPVANLLAWLVSLPVLVGIGYVLIPQFGAAGAAWAISAMYGALALALIVIATGHNVGQRNHGATRS